MTYNKSQPLSSAFTLKKLMHMSINGMCHLYIAALFSIKQNLKQMQRERESARESASALCVRQWFSTFIMLQSFNTVDTPNIKLFLFLLLNCNFAILHCNVNVICRASDRWPWERIIQSPRGHNPQVENIIQRHLACHYHIVFNSFALLSVKFSFLSCSTLSVPEDILLRTFAYPIVSSEQFQCSGILRWRVHPLPLSRTQSPLQKQYP